MIKRIIISAILCLLLSTDIFAYSISGSECTTDGSESDVQSAIDDSSNCDTVIIPSGTFSWASESYGVAGVDIPAGRSVTLQGAGVGSTIIENGVIAYNLGSPLIVTISGSQFVTIKDIEWHEHAIDSWTKDGIIKIKASGSTNGSNFVIRDCKFPDQQDRGIYVQNNVSGLIYNCDFYKGGGAPQGVAIIGDGATSWAENTAWGSEDFVFIEDCNFYYTTQNDSPVNAYNGARFVLRNSYIENTWTSPHGADSGGYRSTYMFEIYNNTFKADGQSVAEIVGTRGGTSIVYNNTATTESGGSYSDNLVIAYYCACEGQSCSQSTCYEPENYPCTDQPGRGYNQTLVPLVEWGNTLDSGDVDFVVANACTGDVVQNNRDYYSDCTYSNGMISCDGGAYTRNYTAYTYPHPLRGVASTPNITGVTIAKKTLIDEFMLAIRTEE